MAEKEKADPLEGSNAKSHPEGELDSVGVTTYMYDDVKYDGDIIAPKHLINVSTVFLQLAKEIKELKGF